MKSLDLGLGLEKKDLGLGPGLSLGLATAVLSIGLENMVLVLKKVLLTALTTGRCTINLILPIDAVTMICYWFSIHIAS